MTVNSFLFSLLLFSVATLSLSQLSEGKPQPAPAQSGAAAEKPEDHILQDGTPVTLELTQDLSSGNATVGQEISFTVAEDIEVDGVTVLRKGELATGKVTEAVPKRRMGRAGKLSFSIHTVHLADGEKAALRSVNDTKGDSHVAGVVGLMASMPVAAAPFFLLMHGENTTFPRGTPITAFLNGDMHLDLTRFGSAAATAQSAAVLTSVEIDSSPPGADVEVDGKHVGRTPATIELASGTNYFILRKAGFLEWRRSEAVRGATFHVHAELKEAGMP
jgi:hypothetical protein